MKRRVTGTVAWWGALLLLVGCQPQSSPQPTADLDRAVEIRAALVRSGGGQDQTADTASAQQPTGWATLRGVFTLNGQAPPRQPLDANKDVEVCAPGGTQILSQRLVVGPDGGIADVVIFLTSKISDDEPWTHPTAKPGDTSEVLFDQKGCIFLPHVVAVQATQTMRIRNSDPDPVGHNVKLSPSVCGPLNQTVPAGGGELLYKPGAQENKPFPVSCSIHPWMSAYIISRHNSYFAVTDSSGAFEIPNLPAGVELEFRVWQEATDFIQNVSLNGAETSWSKGRFDWTLDPTDESKNRIEVSIAASSLK